MKVWESPCACAQHFFLHWLDRASSMPRSRVVRSPKTKRWITLIVAVRLWTCRLILIHFLTPSSSIHVAWMFEFRFEGLVSMVRWCNKWNFGRSRNRNCLFSTACVARHAYVLIINLPNVNRFDSSRSLKNILDFANRFNQQSALHSASAKDPDRLKKQIGLIKETYNFRVSNEFVSQHFRLKPSISIGCQSVIANIFVSSFPHQPSKYNEAIISLRFEFWECICFPWETLFGELWQRQRMAILFRIPFQSLCGSLQPFFLVTASPVTTFGGKDAYGTCTEVPPHT